MSHTCILQDLEQAAKMSEMRWLGLRQRDDGGYHPGQKFTPVYHGPLPLSGR